MRVAWLCIALLCGSTLLANGVVEVFALTPRCGYIAANLGIGLFLWSYGVFAEAISWEVWKVDMKETWKDWDAVDVGYVFVTVVLMMAVGAFAIWLAMQVPA